MVEKMRSNSEWMKNVLLITFVTAVGGFLFGFDNGSISGSVGFLISKFNLDANGIGWVTSSMIVGCIIGVIIAGPIADKIGRKKVLLLTGILFIIGVIGQSMAPTSNILVCFRIIVGIGIGIETTIAPMYIAEVSPAKVRGRLVSFNQLFNTIGNLAIFSFSAWVISHHTQQWNIDHGWRFIFLSGIVPAIVFLLLLFFVPESPRWLIRRGKTDKGMAILKKINPDADTCQKQFDEIKSTTRLEGQNRLKELFTPKLRKALYIGFGVAFFQQITGINAVFYYAPEIFKSAGLNSNGAMSSTVLIGCMLVAATLVSMWIIDKIGRRMLLVIGSICMIIFLAGTGYLFELSTQHTTLLLFFLLGYVAMFSVSFGTVAYVIISEIFPTHIRGVAASIATFALWGGNFLVARFFPVLLESIGSANTFYIFAFTSLLALIFTVTLIPETKGKTLEQIEKEMHS